MALYLPKTQFKVSIRWYSKQLYSSFDCKKDTV